VRGEDEIERREKTKGGSKRASGGEGKTLPRKRQIERGFKWTVVLPRGKETAGGTLVPKAMPGDDRRRKKKSLLKGERG